MSVETAGRGWVRRAVDGFGGGVCHLERAAWTRAGPEGCESFAWTQSAWDSVAKGGHWAGVRVLPPFTPDLGIAGSGAGRIGLVDRGGRCCAKRGELAGAAVVLDPFGVAEDGRSRGTGGWAVVVVGRGGPEERRVTRMEPLAAGRRGCACVYPISGEDWTVRR